MTNTHCRIGKVTDKKTGNSVYRFPEKNLTAYTNDVSFDALKTANQYVRGGKARMVGVVCILNNGTVFHDFEKQNGVTNTQVLGAIDMLHRFALNWMKL